MFLTETWLRARGDDTLCSYLPPASYSIRSFPRPSQGRADHHLPQSLHLLHLLHHLLPFWPLFLRTHPCLSIYDQQTVNFCVYHPPPSGKNKQTDSMFIDQLHSLFKHCNSLHGSSIVLDDFNVHYDNTLNPTTSSVMDLLTTFNLTKAVRQPTPLMTKDTSWTGCCTHLMTTLCSLPPCPTPSPLTTPVSSVTSTLPFHPPNLRMLWHKISTPPTTLPWKQTWPCVSPTCLAPVPMTWTLRWRVSQTTMPNSYLLLLAAIQNKTKTVQEFSGRKSGDLWMNEWMKIYITHKKLPYKTMHVHSIRYTQCIHLSSCKLKTTKGHSYQKIQTAPTHPPLAKSETIYSS